MSKNIEHVPSEMVFNYVQHMVKLEFSKSIWRAPYMHDKEKEGYYTQLLKRSRRNLTPRTEDYKGFKGKSTHWDFTPQKGFLSALRNF